MSGSHPSPPPSRAGGPGRRPRLRTGRLLVLAVLLLPVVELAVAIQVGRRIGAVPTFLLIVAGIVVGGWVIRRQGIAAWRAFGDAAREGRTPSQGPADAALVLLGGGLFLYPGFVTDVAGLVLVLPFTRRPLRRVLAAWLTRSVLRRVTVTSIRTDVVRGEIVGDPPAEPQDRDRDRE